MALRLLPPAVSPSPAPVCPSPTTIKGWGAPPGHHHTHLAHNRLLPSPQRPLHRAPPPSIVPHRHPVMSDPPPPPLAASEAHLRPLSIFPQPRWGFAHGDAVLAVLWWAFPETVTVVHRGPAPGRLRSSDHFPSACSTPLLTLSQRWARHRARSHSIHAWWSRAGCALAVLASLVVGLASWAWPSKPCSYGLQHGPSE
jgi:hypothetical protein